MICVTRTFYLEIHLIVAIHNEVKRPIFLALVRAVMLKQKNSTINSEVLLHVFETLEVPDSQFVIDGFRQPYRLDSKKHGEGVTVFVSEDISSKIVSKHTLPDDIGGMFTEINLRKTKRLILGTYHPPNQLNDYFFKAVGSALDHYLKTYEKFLLLGDFNAENIESILSEFLEQYEAKNIMKNKTCFKNPDRPTCIDLFLTNSPHIFQNTMTISTGFPDFHKMIITVLKSSFIKLKARETY